MALTISGDEQIAGALTAAERQIAADALHLASSSHADAFVTFDAAMRRRASAIGVRPRVAAP